MAVENLPDFTRPACQRWESIPVDIRQCLLANVWCGQCRHEVLIPARERDEIDWDMVNRLATENRDFLEYVKLLRQFYQTGEARPADWDVPEQDD